MSGKLHLRCMTANSQYTFRYCNIRLAVDKRIICDFFSAGRNPKICQFARFMFLYSPNTPHHRIQKVPVCHKNTRELLLVITGRSVCPHCHRQGDWLSRYLRSQTIRFPVLLLRKFHEFPLFIPPIRISGYNALRYTIR